MTRLFCSASTLGLLAGLALAAPAQTASDYQVHITFGPTHIDCNRLEGDPRVLHLYRGVRVASPDFGMSAPDVHVYYDATKKNAGSSFDVEKATANSLGGARVTGHFEQGNSASKTGAKTPIEVEADKAVYRPDASRPNGGRVDFTGNVILTYVLAAPQPPVVARTEQVAILLGRAPDYPQIEGGPGEVTGTP